MDLPGRRHYSSAGNRLQGHPTPKPHESPASDDEESTGSADSPDPTLKLHVTQGLLKLAQTENQQTRRRLSMANWSARIARAEVVELRHEVEKLQKELEERKESEGSRSSRKKESESRSEPDAGESAANVIQFQMGMIRLEIGRAMQILQRVNVANNELTAARSTITDFDRRLAMLEDRHLKEKETLQSEVQRLRDQQAALRAQGPSAFERYATEGLLRIDGAVWPLEGQRATRGLMGRTLPPPQGMSSDSHLTVANCMVDRDPRDTTTLRVVLELSRQMLALYTVSTDVMSFVAMGRVPLANYKLQCLSPWDARCVYCTLNPGCTANDHERSARSLIRFDVVNGEMKRVRRIKADRAYVIRSGPGCVLAVDNGSSDDRTVRWWRVRCDKQVSARGTFPCGSPICEGPKRSRKPQPAGDFIAASFTPLTFDETGRFCVVSKLAESNSMGHSTHYLAFCSLEGLAYVENASKEIGSLELQSAHIIPSLTGDGRESVRFVLVCVNEVVVLEFVLSNSSLNELKRVFYGSIQSASISVPSVVTPSTPIWLFHLEGGRVIVQNIMSSDPKSRIVLRTQDTKYDKVACVVLTIDASYAAMATAHMGGKIVVWSQGVWEDDQDWMPDS